MPTQNEIARRLLPLILRAAREDGFLLYKGAAQDLGYGANYSKALAQVCDLLDAAAAWADVPLLALRYVRTADGVYNEKAFSAQGQKEYREAIFRRAIHHAFREVDFRAIRDDFRNDSNVSSWKRLYELFDGKEQVWAWLAREAEPPADALDDMCSDVPDSRILAIKSYV